MTTISINDIQKAIQECLASEPPKDGVFLSRDGSLLADILGGMIARGMRSIEDSVVQGEHLEAFNRWIS